MTQETTHRTTPTAWRETLYLAAINCSHSITHDSIVLHRDPAKDGSALAQMADRLAAEAVPGGAAEQSGMPMDERSDCEIMLEWDEHYKSGLTNGTPFLSIVVNFARATARAAVAAHLAGQSRATKVQAVPDLHDAIMNIPCKRTMSHFATRDTMIAYKEGHRDARHAAAELAIDAVTAQEVAQQAAPTDEVKRLRNRVSQLEAARIGYASEFALNADGEPDVGNIHANIRALKAELAAATQQAAKAEQAKCGPAWYGDMDNQGHAVTRCRTCGTYKGAPCRLAPTTSTVSAPEEVRNQALEEGLEMAARHLDKWRQAVDQDHAFQEPDTGAWVLDRPETEEYSNTLAELADEIRALKRTTTDKGEAA